MIRKLFTSLVSSCLIGLNIVSAAEVRSFPLTGGTVALERADSQAGAFFRAFRPNRATGRWEVDLVVTNGTTKPLRLPLVLRFETAERVAPGILGTAADSDGKSFLDLTAQAGGSELAPGAVLPGFTLALGDGQSRPELRVAIYCAPEAPAPTLTLVRTLTADGLPLSGVTAEELGPDTAQSFTSARSGWLTLESRAGVRGWRFRLPGCEPVVRLASELAPGVVTELPSVRLMASAAGGLQRFPAEASPAPLPRGWSPALIARTGSGTQSVELVEVVPASQAAVLAQWDEGGLFWRAVKSLTADGQRNVALNFPVAGLFTVLVPDSAPVAPRLPVVGEAVGGVISAVDPTTLLATGRINPASSPARREAALVTATATVQFSSPAGALSSGLRFPCQVTEEYQLRDGSRRQLPAYTLQLIGYRGPGAAADGPVVAQFPVRPFQLLTGEELAEAVIRVEVLAPAAFAGGVLDATGGSLADGPIRVTAGANDFERAEAAVLRQLTVSNQAGIVPAGLKLVQTFELSVADAKPGRRLALRTGPVTQNGRFMLARAVFDEGRHGFQPVERLHSDAEGALVSDEPEAGERLAGVDGGGQYWLFQTATANALVSGVIRNRDGAPTAGVLVRTGPWTAFTDAAGRYQLAAPAGTTELTILDPRTEDSGSATLTVTADFAAIIANADTAGRGPRVLLATPAAGSTNVSRVTSVTLNFSRALNPATLLGDAVKLTDSSGAAIPADPPSLNLARTALTLLPTAQLPASAQITVTLAATVADLVGRPLEGPREFSFKTESDVLRRDDAALTIFEPVRGLAPMVGGPGMAEPDSPVILVNDTTGFTSTVLSKPDGSFTNSIPADVDDFISVVLVNRNGTRNTMPASRQVFQDGRVGLYQQGGILEVQGEAGPIQVNVPPGAINGRSVFTFEPLRVPQILAAANGVAPQDVKLLQGFHFKVEGDVPKEGLDVSFTVDPATFQMPPGENPEDASLGLLVPQEVEGVTAYRMVDKLRFKNGKAFSNTPPFPLIGGFLLDGILDFNTTLALFGSKPVVVSGIAAEPKASVERIRSELRLPQFALDALLAGGFIGNLGFSDTIDDLISAGEFFQPVSGAFVFARPLGTVNNLPGRIQAGAVYATTDRKGLYALALPIKVGEAAVPFSRADGYNLVTIHPRYKHRLVEPLDFSEIGVDFGEKPFFRRNLIFSGPLANGGTSPTLRLESALQPTAPALNQPAKLRVVAFSNQGEAQFNPVVDSVASTVAGQTATTADVRIEDQHVVYVGNGSTEFTATITCAKALQALIRVTATVAGPGGQLADSTLVVARFGEGSPPLPDTLTQADPDDVTGPGVLRANLADGATLPPGGRIVLQFSEPVNRRSVKLAGAIVFSETPLTPPAIFLSADQKTLEIYPGLYGPSVKDVTLNLTSVIRDLAGRSFDQSPEPGFQTYHLTVRLPVTRQLDLGGIDNGGGVVSHRGFLYALDRGATPGVRIYSTDDILTQRPAPVATIPLQGQPRDLLVIRDWPHRRSLHDPQVRTGDLLVVVGGDAGSKEVDADRNVFFAGQYLRVFDLSNPRAPERVLGAQLTLRNALVSRVAWSPPYLSYLESGSDIQQVCLVNLQAMLVGFNGTASETVSFSSDGFAGVDLNNNGSFVQSDERLPTPERKPLEFFGKEASFVFNEPGLIQDVASAPGFVGMVTTGGIDPLRTNAPPTLPAYTTLRSNGESLPEGAGILRFDGGARPKRLTVLLDELVSVNGQLERRSLGLVSMAPDHGGKNRVVVVDLSNPLVPTQFADAIELPDSFGLPQSITKREDGLLALATTTHLLLLDPQRLLEPAPGGVGTAGQSALLHPSIISVIPQAGSGNRTQDSDPTGVNVVNLGGRHQLIQSAPRLRFVIFPTGATVANPSALVNNEPALDTLMADLRSLAGIPLARLNTKGGAVSSIVPASPTTHSHVLIECPGGSGPQLTVTLESLNEGGYPLKDKGKDFAPVRAMSSETVQAIGQDADSPGGKDDSGREFRAPVVPLRAHRLSSNPASRYYNVYLSEPFALIREKVTRDQLLTLTASRPILYSGSALRASLDRSNRSNPVIGTFADDLNSNDKTVQPAAFVLADTLSTSYIPGDNPPPPGGEVSFPGTFDLVNALNGEMRRTEVDIALPSRRLPIIFQRTLAGQDLHDGPFGPGWDFNYNQRLVEFKAVHFPQGSKAPLVVRDVPERSSTTESGDVQFVDGEGHVILFKNQGTNAPAGVQGDPLAEDLGWFSKGGVFYTPDVNTKNVFDVLYRHPGGEYCRLTPGGTQYWYLPDGRLHEIKDRHAGNRHELEYKRGELIGITDHSATPPRKLEIGHFRLNGDRQSDLDQVTESAFVAGQICALRDFVGRVTSYEYAPTGVLLTVRHPETDSTALSSAGPVGFKGRPTTRYLMKTPAQGGFQGVIEGNGANSTDGGTNSGTALFAANLETTGGKPVVKDGDGAGGKVTAEVKPDNTAEAGPEAAGNAGHRADKSNTRYSFDAHGQPTGLSQTGPKADEAATGIVYAPEPELRGLVKSITGPEGDIISYDYFNGSLIRSKPNLRKVTRTPGARGGPVITSSFSGYDQRYNLPTDEAKNANGKSITYTLTRDKKQIASIAYGGEALAAWTYNEFGQKESESTPEGVTRGWAYDNATGFLTSQSIGQVTTTYSYDGTVAAQLGQPTRVTVPLGQAVSITYDSRLLPLSQTRGAQQVKRAYDENGNEVFVSTAVDAGVAREEVRTFNQVSFLTSRTVKGIESGSGSSADLITAYTPDEVFRVHEVHLPAPTSETQVMEYDHLGRLLTITTGEQVTEFTYDLNGNLLKTKLSNAGILGSLVGSVVEKKNYDGHDRPVTIVRPGSGGDEKTTLSYFDGGELKTRTVTGETGGTVEDIVVTDVDGYGRPSGVKRNGTQASGVIGYTYSASTTGLTVVQTGPVGSITNKTDTAGRLTQMDDTLASRTFQVNDSFMTESVSSVESGTTYKSGMSYDDLDRLTSLSDDVGTIVTHVPRLDGLPIKSTDALDHVTTFTHSKLGELLRADRPESLRTSREYDTSRRMAGIRDRDSKGHGYAYDDGRLRMTKQTLRNGAEIKFNVPNGFNLPARVLLPGGGSIGIDYDGQGRVLGANVKFNGTTHTIEDTKFDAAGRVRAISYQTHDQGNSATFTYDKLGPLTGATYTEGGATYAFAHGIREDGARTSVTYPSGTVVTEGRDPGGRLTSVSIAGESAPIWQVTAFAGVAEPKTITRGPLAETRSYDLRKRLLSAKILNAGGAVLSDWRYLWDAGDNLLVRQAVHEQGRAEIFTYDQANRLTRVHFGARPAIPDENAEPIPGLAAEQGFSPGYAARTFTYDAGGLDLLTASAVTDAPEAKPVALAPFALAISEHDDFLNAHLVDGFDRGTPDDLGNTAKIRHGMLDSAGQFTTQTATLTHNGRNDLVKAERGGETFLFHYRPDRLLHRKTHQTAIGTVLTDRALVWDGPLLMEEYDLLASPQRLLARYYYAGGDTPVAADLADAGGTLHRFHFLHDNVMSVTALVDDATGTAVERMHYDPWGGSRVELKDTITPQVSRVFEEADGSLLVQFSEPVLPPANAGPTGLVTGAGGLDGLFSVVRGGSEVPGQVSYVETAGGLPFGTLVRFTPSSPQSGTLTVEVVAGQVLDSWGNGNAPQTLVVPLVGGVGERFTGGVTDTRPTTQAASAVGNPFRFQGQYAELELGLIYMRARFYDPQTATFLERDPLEYKDSVNLYAALGQAPVAVRDPSGEGIGGTGGRDVLKAVVKKDAKAIAEQFTEQELKEIDEVVYKELARMGLPEASTQQLIDRTVREAIHPPIPFPKDNSQVFERQIVTPNLIDLRTKDGFSFTAILGKDNKVTINAYLVNPNTRARSIHADVLGSGRENYERMFAHFGDRIEGWHGCLAEDNFKRMRELLPSETNNAETVFGLFKSKTGQDFWLPWIQKHGFEVQGEASLYMDAGFYDFEVQFVRKMR